MTSSPEPYSATVGKLGDVYLETPLGRRENVLESLVGESVSNAARTLHALQQLGSSAAGPTRAGSKRGRSDSLEGSLQDNVRDILNTNSEMAGRWPDSLVRSKSFAERRFTSSAPLLVRRGSKRLCCSTEASQELRGDFRGPSLSTGLGRAGLWTGILND